ncbi:sugar ABC transporter permease [Herbaspirillum sp. BH-1]|uniref:Multiple sugar transport system permease protein n=1 Tax=Herbaspirillum frisingense TaxID=92645 RepID=A0ABU1PAQ2_9BURK|nr:MULTISPECIES: sugar ABC transporter permease [Herbaspirillum]MDR6582999.1 multiple sugar transport system permease protein [Herbaspirillum frisingense]PLY60421.1 sugar ABC transporter permease [Herbaspirillum sp. BH-1]
MKNNRLAYLLMLPALLVIAVTTVFPLLYSLALSFRSWKLAYSSVPGPFVGLHNYAELLAGDSEFVASIATTLSFVGIDVLATCLIALGCALLLRRAGRVTSVARALLMLPFVMSPALIGISLRFFLNPEYGVIAASLGKLFPGLASLIWLAHPAWAMVALVISDVWHWAPYMTLILLGGLASVPKETEEAAAVDGASPLRIFVDITLPQLKPVVAVVILLKTVFALKAFDAVFALTDGGPGNATTTLAYLVYQIGFKYYDMGYAAAAGYVLTAVMLVLAGFYMRLAFKKGI